jgi:type IV fimbrial biogenesis protein FimT
MPSLRSVLVGFSLLEMMLVLAVAGWLLTSSFPLLQLISGRARLEAGVHAIAGAMVFACSEALRSGRPVHLCALHRRRNDYLLRCRPGGSAAEPWDQGALIYADAPVGASTRYDRREDLRDISWPRELRIEAGAARFRCTAAGQFDGVPPAFRLTDPPSGLCARVQRHAAVASPKICFGSACDGGC